MSKFYTEFFPALDREIDQALPLFKVPFRDGVTACITGGRDFDDWLELTVIMDHIDQRLPIHLFIEGGATGADRLGYQWAAMRRRITRSLPARWRRLGLAAGPERNSKMKRLLEDANPPGVLIAFPGGNGTADMTAKCNMAGLPVIDIQNVLDACDVANKVTRHD
jgi:hypothetical protein